LLLEYTFEGNALDSSGNDHNGAVNGAPTYVEGKKGQCLSFGGSDWVDSGFVLPQMDTFTVECWVNPGDTQVTWADILGNHAGGGVSGMVLQQLRDDANQYVFVYGSSAGSYVESKPLTLSPGKWHHVACVKDVNEARFFLNGVLMDAMPATGPMAVSTIPFRVGLGFPGVDRCFKGKIDEVRVWNKALDRFDVSVSDAEQLEQFASVAAAHDYVTVRWLQGRGIVASGQPAEIELSLDPRFLPAAATSVDVTFDVTDYAGNKCAPISALALRADAAFKAKAALPSTPGYYHVAYHPVAAVAGQAVPLGTGGFSFTVLADTPPVASSSSDVPGAANPAPLSSCRWMASNGLSPQTRVTSAVNRIGRPVLSPMRNPRRRRGSCKTPFPGIMAWRGIGANLPRPQSSSARAIPPPVRSGRLPRRSLAERCGCRRP